MLWAVVLIPAVAAAAALAIRWRAARRVLLPAAGAAHLACVIALCGGGVVAVGDGRWIGLDEPGKLFLTVASVLFVAAASYTFGQLRGEHSGGDGKVREGFLFAQDPEAVFIACMLAFLATMSLVCVSRHLGLLWVAVEATTLVSAPLIYHHRHHRSLEAAWKYLLICSVGIAIAMLGNFCLAFAARGQSAHLSLGGLLAVADKLDPMWLRAAFLMFLVGYGTKMGLAPMHTWLPDAHSEAPSGVSALLSGALLNCAFLGILRAHAVMAGAGLAAFSGELLVLLGMVSMGVAAVFLIRQADYKRMLAYSSIEHMGILALGVGLGGLAAQGSLLHAVNHSMGKGLLFLTAGTILASWRTKNAGEVRGLLRRAPLAGVLWLAGFLAIAGSPPWGLFLSELTILRGALEGGRWFVAGGYLLALGVIFVAMARIVLPMAFGEPSPAALPSRPRRDLWSLVPASALGAAVLALGVYVPPQLWAFLQQAAAAVGGR
jgi:hydrogenase-4 component F